MLGTGLPAHHDIIRPLLQAAGKAAAEKETDPGEKDALLQAIVHYVSQSLAVL